MARDAVVTEWRALSRQFSAVACALDRALHRAHGMGMSEFEVLDRLAEAGAPVRMHGLAVSVHLSQSALSRTVARLERHGLVARSLCADDRRGIYVQLTPHGAARHSEALPTQRAVLADHLRA